jgi:hypothetical protein
MLWLPNAVIYWWLRPFLGLHAIALALRVGLAFAPLIDRTLKGNEWHGEEPQEFPAIP